MRRTASPAPRRDVLQFRVTRSPVWDPLETRLHLHAGHEHGTPAPGALTPRALTPQFVDYLNSLPLDSPAPFDVHLHEGAEGSHDVEPPPASASAPFTTILDNGPSSNRIDIVLVGDGYTAAQLGTYAAHANNAVTAFFNQLPLSIYRPLFNVHRVDVTSNESGVDNDPTPGVSRDTALDMGFWCSGIERLLCVDTFKAASFAASAPDVDQILAVANSTKYGGAGYGGNNLGTFSGGNSSALEVALHEFGHSFADLADEYDYADGATYTGSEPVPPNVSKLTAAQMATAQTKWHRWLDLPEVDAFEGAMYHQFGIYRPTVNSKMRSLGRPFEAVNNEQFIISMYRTVRPIDSATPSGTYTNLSDFTVTPVGPLPTMRIQWTVDGVAVPGATSMSFNPASLNLSGTRALGVRVFDNTMLVRDPGARATLLTDTRTWTILDAQPPGVSGSSFDVDQPRMRARFTFTEDVGSSLSASDFTLVNLTTGQTIPAPDLTLAYDPATRSADVTFTGFPQGILPDGRYRATLTAGSVSDGSGNALSADVSLDFFFVQADATRDGRVNLDDFNVLAKHFGETVTTFTRGDFTYDGQTDLDDFNVLAGRFGQQIPIASGSTTGNHGQTLQTDDALEDLLA
jgi:hypothetical protein